LTQTARSAPPISPGINVIGHVTGNLGLGVAARNTLFALSRSGEPFEAVDVDPGGGRGGHEATYEANMRDPAQAAYGINLFQLNPPDIACMVQATSPPPWLSLADRTNAVVPFWELPRLPVKLGWIPLVEAVDAVLAPSRFIADAVAASAPSATVWHYPQAVFLPDAIVSDRRRFGLPEDAVLFYLSLDVTSDLARKNPLATLEAFEAAFPSGAGQAQADSSGAAGRGSTSEAGAVAPDVHLVVKLNNSGAFSWAGRTAQQVRSLLAEDPRITVIDRAMSYEEALGLSASCDVYVSLHRSEGLGLNLLEAMSLGKPVVATGWSGNMDFMTAENSCLVGFEMIPVVAEHAAYQPDIIGPGQTWADPSVDEAADWMRRLAADAELRRSIGQRAAADMAALRERFLRGEVFARLEELRHQAFADTTPAQREARWDPVRRVSLPLRARRLGGRVLRTLGLRR